MQSQSKVIYHKYRTLRKPPEWINGYVLDDLGSGVIVFVYSVAEARENSLSTLYLIDELGDILFCSNFLQHSDDSFVGSSMPGSIESSSGHSDGGIDINS